MLENVLVVSWVFPPAYLSHFGMCVKSVPITYYSNEWTYMLGSIPKNVLSKAYIVVRKFEKFEY